tara:strand:- start:105 stop:431 length:327 start_codon:yes stop_codon:yes gene_type:complete
MANLNTKIKLYLEANSETWDNTKVELQDDSDDKGVYIKTWNYDIPKPSNTKLNSYETAGNTKEALQVILSNRANNYPTMADQLDDIFHNGIDSWKASIQIIKDKYPKE